MDVRKATPWTYKVKVINVGKRFEKKINNIVSYIW